jgi:hypothetical protein
MKRKNCLLEKELAYLQIYLLLEMKKGFLRQSGGKSEIRYLDYI